MGARPGPVPWGPVGLLQPTQLHQEDGKALKQVL